MLDLDTHGKLNETYNYNENGIIIKFLGVYIVSV